MQFIHWIHCVNPKHLSLPPKPLLSWSEHRDFRSVCRASPKRPELPPKDQSLPCSCVTMAGRTRDGRAARNSSVCHRMVIQYNYHLFRKTAKTTFIIMYFKKISSYQTQWWHKILKSSLFLYLAKSQTISKFFNSYLDNA